LVLVLALVSSAAIGVALASMGDTAVAPSQPTVVAEERDEPSAVASPLPKPLPEPKPEQARPEPKPEQARPEPVRVQSEEIGPGTRDEAPAKPARVAVAVAIQKIKRGEIRIGQGTVVSFGRVAKVKLRPGSYPLSWRKHGADSWHEIGRVKVHVDDPEKQWLLVYVSSEGEVFREVRYKSGRRWGP